MRASRVIWLIDEMVQHTKDFPNIYFKPSAHTVATLHRTFFIFIFIIGWRKCNKNHCWLLLCMDQMIIIFCQFHPQNEYIYIFKADTPWPFLLLPFLFNYWINDNNANGSLFQVESFNKDIPTRPLTCLNKIELLNPSA